MTISFVSTILAGLSGLIEHTNSYPLQLLLSLGLGLLLSLTPCIFPMIPITIGVLQGTGGKSRLRSFCIAFAYMLGVSLTFALLGLLVASGGLAFGQLARSPFFILSLVTFLVYLALSMFGLYEMHVPAFLKPKAKSHSQNSQKNGSILSAFLFGMASGTVASPCLSPGLALILTIVATLQNKLLGFLLLFVFGVGSALPLLLIGTFSSSLSLLPKAGVWMVEVKKLFGFMLCAACFYYLAPFFASSVLMWLIAEFLLITGLWYFSAVHSYDTIRIKWYKKALGAMLVCASFFCFFYAWLGSKNDLDKKKAQAESDSIHIVWESDYEQALARSAKEKKPLFIVYTTDFCPSCLVLEKKYLQNKLVQRALESFVCVKIADLSPVQSLIGAHEFLPTPTVLIAKDSGTYLMNVWKGDDIMSTPIERFLELLVRYK